jgi:integrase
MDLINYSENLSRRLVSAGQFRTAEAYRSAGRSLSNFLGREAQWTDITAEKMKRYEKWLEGKSLARNTISFYMRNLRAIQNKALAESIIQPLTETPFKEVYTGTAKTQKRAMNEDDLGAVVAMFNRTAEEKEFPVEFSDALALFLFCFFAQGMSFVDAVMLKKADLNDGLIIYRRRKTKGEIRVVLTPQLQMIIDWFADSVKDSPYLFPFINPNRETEYKQYLSLLAWYNRMLKKIGKAAGIKKPFASHAARHSWASLARNKGVPTATISAALGHSDEKTTQIYLDSLDMSLIEQASRKVADKFVLNRIQKRVENKKNRLVN